MVNTVISHQLSVIRNFTEITEFLRFLIVNLKKIFFLFFLLITDNRLLMTSLALARDLGTHGIIYPIVEEDPLRLIQKKLKSMEEKGDLEKRNRELQQKTKAAIERPKSVQTLTKAIHSRVFYYDPTYRVPEDIQNHKGQLIHKKGTTINPLKTVTLSQSLLFFDGDNGDQVSFAKDQLKEKSVKLILVKGAPLALSDEWNVPVYFDQGGFLTKKLGISQVPALVQQEGMRLRIEEIFLGEKL